MERFGGKYRHEYKYLLDERDILLCQSAIREIMKPDPHSLDGAYRIRSVYFDDYEDTCLRSNLDGTSPRAKYRIRIYNESPDSIHLEKKEKWRDLTLKKSCLLSLEESKALLESSGALLDARDRPLLKEFKTQCGLRLLHPVVLVEYDRTAYVCREGNVRITFDRNLASSSYTDRLFAQRLPKRPVMEPGKHLMEVKYDEFLPGYIRKSLNTGKLERTTFSKYMMCRVYH